MPGAGSIPWDPAVGRQRNHPRCVGPSCTPAREDAFSPAGALGGLGAVQDARTVTPRLTPEHPERLQDWVSFPRFGVDSSRAARLLPRTRGSLEVGAAPAQPVRAAPRPLPRCPAAGTRKVPQGPKSARPAAAGQIPDPAGLSPVPGAAQASPREGVSRHRGCRTNVGASPPPCSSGPP